MNRIISFDILRIIACVMIIVMHSPIPKENSSNLFLSSLSYFSASGIGLFFMVSGALLLPVKTDLKFFIKRRFTKIIIPTIFWSLFYLCVNALFLNQPIRLKELFSILFSAQGNSVLWFIYTLIGLYLLAPILSKWIQAASCKEIQFYLCIWLISLCFPFLKYVVLINTSNEGILYYFSGYVGYFILGYYMKTYPKKLSWKVLIPALIISIVVPVLCKMRRVDVNFYDMFWYLSIFVAIQCLCWWKLICDSKKKIISKRALHYITEFSKMTFGVYLVHIFIMRYVLWKCDIILSIENYYLQTATIVMLTFLLSALFTYLIGLIPQGQYLVGYDSLSSKESKNG